MADDFDVDSISFDDLEGLDDEAELFPWHVDVFQREIMPIEIEHLLSCWAFLEVADFKNPDIPTGAEPQKHQSKHGWPIHDYGNLIRTAAPYLTLGLGSVSSDDDETGSGAFIQDAGTAVAQYVEVANEIAAIAAERWEIAQVLDGYQKMQRAFWIAGNEIAQQGKNFSVEGFESTPVDYVVSHFVEQMRSGAMRG